VARIAVLQIRVARTHQQASLHAGLTRLERLTAEVILLICETFLWSLNTRVVGCIVVLLAEGEVGAQAVSWFTRNFDQTVAKFHQ